MASWSGKTALATCAGATAAGHLQPLPKAAMARSFQSQHQRQHQHQHQHQHHVLQLLPQHQHLLPGLLPQLSQL